MNINVTATKVTIDKGNVVNKGEYNIRDCIFILSEEYNDLVCKALFTVEKTNTTYEQSIVNNKCTIPYEVTVEKGAITLGVIGYEIEDDELIKRYSPLPYHFTIEDGSYVEDIENQSTPTPSEIEQLEQRLSQVEIDAAQVEINTEDIADIKEEQITQNNDILLRSLITETGSQIELSLNSTNFKMTATLKDKNGTVVNTSNEIDLPLESVVVNASYDSSTKELVLTLQNGTTVRVSIADLVSGLVSNTDYASSSKGGVIKTNAGLEISGSTGLVRASDYTFEQYNSAGRVNFISKGTLENVITGKQLINKTQLDESQATQDTAIQTLQTENTRLKATLPTTTGSGENITLSKTAELEFIQPPLPRGNSEQVQYSGKNLLQNTSSSITTNGVTITVNEDGSLQLTGTATGNVYYYLQGGTSSYPLQLQAGTYTLSGAKSSSIFIRLGNANGMQDDLGSGKTFTINEATNYYCLLRITTGTATNTTIYPMIEEGSTATSYEPYVGGIASPNPSYPQEITNVTGDVEVLVQNKNLCKINSEIKTAGGTDLSQNGISYSIDNEGTITLNGTANYNNTYILSNLDLIPNTYNISMNYVSGTISSGSTISVKDDSSNNIKQITANNNDVNDSFTNTVNAKTLTLYIASNKVFTNYKIRLQLEQGSTATTYTPHQEQTFTFPLGTQRMYLGDYLADDGIHHVRKQITLDGISDGLKFTSAEPSRNNRFSLGKSGIKEQTYTQNTYMKSSHFSYNVSVFFDAQDQIGFAVNKSIIYVRFGSSSEINTITKANNWLASNLPTLEYELAEEEITPYTTEQQTAYDEIKQAFSYDEQTNISGSSDESNPIFSVEAYQSIKLVLAG